MKQLFKITSLLLVLVPSVLLASELGKGKVKAPNFRLTDITSGKQVSLSDYRGKVVYLDFWASWCGPCRKSFPAMQAIYDAKKQQGFEVVTINLDENSKLGQNFLNEFPVTFTNLFDAQKTTPEAYQVSSMPSSYLIDRSGNIRLAHRGFKGSDKESIAKAIDILLSER
ncbi:MAG: TlpA disulfide reductase family protein [Kangiellaceae bacterium]|jgi:thiol-disulfide isomerase/thioredoxin|nr:TlpA disulfide reductase family protein [Kangiellaceae bacterium]